MEVLFSDPPLGEFIRNLVGLNQEAAKIAFAKLMKERSLNAAQMQFLDKVIEHVVAVGIVKPGDLYEQPFTFLDDRGIDGIFEPADRELIFNVLTNIRSNAQFSFAN